MTASPSIRLALALPVEQSASVNDDEITWFWIGDHAGYDRLLKSV